MYHILWQNQKYKYLHPSPLDLDGFFYMTPPHGVLILLYEVIYNAKKVK